VGTVQKIIETQAKSIPLPHIHDRALSWLGTSSVNKK